MTACCPPVTMNYNNITMHNPLDTELNLQRILIFPAAANTLSRCWRRILQITALRAGILVNTRVGDAEKFMSCGGKNNVRRATNTSGATAFKISQKESPIIYFNTRRTWRVLESWKQCLWKWKVRILTFKYLVESVIMCGLMERNKTLQILKVRLKFYSHWLTPWYRRFLKHCLLIQLI